MIDGDGNVRILDFGIAAALDDQTTQMALAGTPGFVVPELLTGQAPSPQSDIYSWGVVVYYAAIGHMPQNEKSDPQPSIEEVLRASGIDADLAAWICACLQTNPDLRHDRRTSWLWHCRRAILCTPRWKLAVSPPDLLLASHSWRPSCATATVFRPAGWRF